MSAGPPEQARQPAELARRSNVERLEQARQLTELARRDPATTLVRAAQLAAAAGSDIELRVSARHAAVLARIELGQPVPAAELGRLVRAAERAGLSPLVARLRLTQAWLDLDRGRPEASLRQLDAVQPGLRGVELARARCLRGLHLTAAGGHVDAVVELSVAAHQLDRHADRHWLANALVGRGTAAGYLQHTDAAAADFARAAELYAELGAAERSAACVHNRGFVALRAGDLPLALHCFAEAERRGLRPMRHPEALVDRAQALLAAGLAGTARPMLATAARLLATSGRGTKLAEATLVVAQGALRAGDVEVAAEAAGRAAALFGRQRRPAWRVAARAVELTARLSAPRARQVAVAGRVAAAGERHGWPLLAAELRLAAAGRASPQVAKALLTHVAKHRHRGPVAFRAMGWLAHARLAGDRRAVFAACRAGLALVDGYAAALGAWELQAGMSAHANELARLGVAAALAGGRPRQVLRWTDRHRAVACDRPALRSPADPALAEKLVALRSAVAAHRPARQVVALENDVRVLDWSRRAATTSRPTWNFPELATELGTAALVSMLERDGRTILISFVDGRCRVHDVAESAAVDSAMRALRFATTMGIRVGQDRSAATESAGELDRLLFSSIRRLLGDRPLVLVPTGASHAVPWAALATCVGRPVSVTPSISAWLRAKRAPVGNQNAVWVAGPGLRHAEHEVRSLHATHGGRLLIGRQSTVDQVRDAMDGADTVHIATHGRFRDDQPLFSCLELADGPLYGYDLQRLHRAPRRVVLSACDAGLAAVRPGDEVIGTTTAFLRAGSGTVLASVLPVPDERAAGMMTTLHAGLRAGLGPAEALAKAQARHGHLGFVCFGAGS